MEAYFHYWTQNGSIKLEVENATWSPWIHHVTETTGKEEDFCTVWSC